MLLFLLFLIFIIFDILFWHEHCQDRSISLLPGYKNCLSRMFFFPFLSFHFSCIAIWKFLTYSYLPFKSSSMWIVMLRLIEIITSVKAMGHETYVYSSLKCIQITALIKYEKWVFVFRTCRECLCPRRLQVSRLQGRKSFPHLSWGIHFHNYDGVDC